MVHNVTGYSVMAHFATRQEAELAVEHLVREHHIDRKSIIFEAGGGDPTLRGTTEVRVACQPGHALRIEAALKQAGAR